MDPEKEKPAVPESSSGGTDSDIDKSQNANDPSSETKKSDIADPLLQEASDLNTPPTTTQEEEEEDQQKQHDADPDPDPEKQDLTDSDINADPTTGQQQQQLPLQKTCSLPPDFLKLSQDIDLYITSLSSSKHHDPDSPPNPPPESVPICVDQFALLFENKIDGYDSPDNPVKWTLLTDADSALFLEAVDRISRLYTQLCEYSSDYRFASSINRIGDLLQRAMAYLEEEFRSLLEDYKIPDSEYHPHVPSSTPSEHHDQDPHHKDGEPQENPPPEEDHPPAQEKDDHSPSEIGYSVERLSNLSKLSKAMIEGGYETECCQVYFITRRNALDETLHKFGFVKHSIDDVQKMNWETLEREIMAWINTFKQCANSEFPRERKILDSIFPDYPGIWETIFCSLSRGVIVELVNFSEAVAMSKRAAEKLFKLLDIYETLRDILPSMDSMLPAESMDEMKSEAMLTRSRLGEAMVSIFCELENSIKADTGKTPVPGGAVHPLTRYTINYLKYACEYKDTLEQVFREHQKIERADSATGSDFDYNSQNQNNSSSSSNNNNNNNNNNNQKAQQSPFQVQMVKVMDLLDANLESKSKLYKDLSLSWIFLMNNGRYILQKVRGSTEISSLMGDAWCRKRSSDLRQYHKSYQRETWGKLLNCLINHEGLTVNGKVVKPVLKERFKSFNAMFDEIHKTQSGWVVSDEQLQSELRVSISNMVIPAYRAFMARYGPTLTPGRQTEKYVKYQAEDIETYVDELFDGNTNPSGKRKT